MALNFPTLLYRTKLNFYIFRRARPRNWLLCLDLCRTLRELPKHTTLEWNKMKHISESQLFVYGNPMNLMKTFVVLSSVVKKTQRSRVIAHSTLPTFLLASLMHFLNAFFSAPFFHAPSAFLKYFELIFVCILSKSSTWTENVFYRF